MKDKGISPAALMALLNGDLANAEVAATPGGIEMQEKAGQLKLVNSTDMPLSLYPSKEAFQKLGFKFGKPIDDLFQQAELPAGWSRKATDHSMHSDIVDEQGRTRVSVFYKAAFYDRKADAQLMRRFKVTTQYPNCGMPGAEDLAKDEVRIVVMDCNTVIKASPKIARNDYKFQDEAADLLRKWLKMEHPLSDDPTECW